MARPLLESMSRRTTRTYCIVVVVLLSVVARRDVATEMKAKLEELRRWSEARGAGLSAVTFEWHPEYGSLVRAAVPLKATDVAIRMPWSTVIDYASILGRPIIGPMVKGWYAEAQRGHANATAKQMLQSAFSAFDANTLVADDTKLLALTAGLHYERFYATDGEYDAVLGSFPTSYETLPAEYTPEELQIAFRTPEMEAYNAHVETQNGKRDLIIRTLLSRHPEVYGASDEVTVTRWRGEMQWALNSVQTRAFAKRLEMDYTAMYPVMDLMNHAPNTPVVRGEAVMDATGMVRPAGLVMTPGKSLNVGDQVFSSYHAHDANSCAHYMLLLYGFVPVDHTHDCAVVLLRGMGADTSLMAASRNKWWQEMADRYGHKFVLDYEDPLPPGLMAVLRSMAMSAADMQDAVASKWHGTVPLNMENEGRAYTQLKKLLHAMIDQRQQFLKEISTRSSRNIDNLRSIHNGAIRAMMRTADHARSAWEKLLAAEDDE